MFPNHHYHDLNIYLNHPLKLSSHLVHAVKHRLQLQLPPSVIRPFPHHPFVLEPVAFVSDNVGNGFHSRLGTVTTVSPYPTPNPGPTWSTGVRDSP